jgi:hypothetical protein
MASAATVAIATPAATFRLLYPPLSERSCATRAAAQSPHSAGACKEGGKGPPKLYVEKLAGKLFYQLQ